MLPGLLLALLLIAVLAVWIAGARWRSAASLVEERLRSAVRPMERGTFHPSVLDTLPAPVARYLERALRPGLECPQWVELRQVGTFRMGEQDRWRPFDATEQFTLGPPGFVWDAAIHLVPGIEVLVRDTYLAGEGGLRASLSGLVPLVRSSPSPELRAGALVRYLAEAVWFPHALLPSRHLRWEAIDAESARATLTDGRTQASLVFTFDRAGDVVRVHAPSRPCEQRGAFIMLPWTVRCWDHAERNGMRIPLSAEVLWHFPSADRPYWRGQVVGHAVRAAAVTARAPDRPVLAQH